MVRPMHRTFLRALPIVKKAEAAKGASYFDCSCLSSVLEVVYRLSGYGFGIRFFILFSWKWDDRLLALVDPTGFRTNL